LEPSDWKQLPVSGGGRRSVRVWTAGYKHDCSQSIELEHKHQGRAPWAHAVRHGSQLQQILRRTVRRQLRRSGVKVQHHIQSAVRVESIDRQQLPVPWCGQCILRWGIVIVGDEGPGQSKTIQPKIRSWDSRG
jgi:hypothetical protein